MQIISVLRPRFLNETAQCHFPSESRTCPLYRCSLSHGAATQLCRHLHHDRPSTWLSASLHSSIPGYLKLNANFSSVLLMGQEQFRENKVPRSDRSNPVDPFTTLLLPICHLRVTTYGKPLEVSRVPSPLTLSTLTARNLTRQILSTQLPQSCIHPLQLLLSGSPPVSEWTAKTHCSLITQSGGYLRGLAQLISTTTYHVRSLWMALDL